MEYQEPEDHDELTINRTAGTWRAYQTQFNVVSEISY